MSSRFVPIGSGSNNECCACGFVLLGSSCSGVCGEPNTSLYGGFSDSPPGVLDVPCFPQSCCPCPSIESDRKVLLSITTNPGAETCDFGGWNEHICLNRLAGIELCRDSPADSAGGGLGPSCYETYSYGEMGKALEIEKYGKKDHIFPSIIVDGEECAGAKADISLCCCGDYGSKVKDAGTPTASSGECHTCNYVLTIQFKPVFGSDYCHCPDSTDTILLGYTQGLATPTTWFNQFELISSNCDPLYLEYEATGLYWNCGPCLNGDGVSDNTVELYATITEDCP